MDYPKSWQEFVTEKEKLVKEPLAASVIRDNKYYVGSRQALRKSWGHGELDDAIKHATELLEKTGDEQFVVKIVRVVRRKKQPVEVKVVP